MPSPWLDTLAAATAALDAKAAAAAAAITAAAGAALSWTSQEMSEGGEQVKEGIIMLWELAEEAPIP